MLADCENACSFFPETDASSGDTLACRIFHTSLAAADGGAGVNPHCWHAGPYGFNVCGDECATFCEIATAWCEPDAGFDGGPPFSSLSDCMTKCNGFVRIAGGDAGVDVDGGFSALGPTSGDTLDCREWHLLKALEGQGALGQNTHCPHLVPNAPDGAVLSPCH
jgi:hypothetical protein